MSPTLCHPGHLSSHPPQMVPAVVATMDTACAAAAAAKPDIAKALAQEMSDPVAWAKLVNWLAPG
jgi:hypothetical protein